MKEIDDDYVVPHKNFMACGRNFPTNFYEK